MGGVGMEMTGMEWECFDYSQEAKIGLFVACLLNFSLSRLYNIMRAPNI